MCATITLRSSACPYLLPVSSLISNTGLDLPITPQNAVRLPAHFALVLDTPLPLSQVLNVTLDPRVEKRQHTTDVSQFPLIFHI